MPNIIITKRSIGGAEPSQDVQPLFKLIDPTTEIQPVDSWTDSMGSGLTWTGTGSARPSRVVSPYFNDRPALAFDGVDDLMLADPTNVVGMTDQGGTIAVCFRADSIPAAASNIMFGLRNNDTGNPFLQVGVNSDGRLRFQTDGSSAAGGALSYVPANQWSINTTYVFIGRLRADGHSETFLNGTSMEVSEATTVPEAGTYTMSHIGAYYNGNGYFDGTIAEIRGYDYSLPDNEIVTVSNVMMARYGIVA